MTPETAMNDIKSRTQRLGAIDSRTGKIVECGSITTCGGG